jgi:hypothetical protein
MFNIEARTVDKEEEGEWAQFKGSEFLIASSGCNRFQRLFSKLQMPHRRALDKNRLDPTIQLDIMSRAMSKAILLNWRDVVGNDGNAIEYSSDMAYAALMGNSELREFVTAYATDLNNYLDEELDDLGKSVEVSSNGTSNTATEKSS